MLLPAAYINNGRSVCFWFIGRRKVDEVKFIISINRI